MSTNQERADSEVQVHRRRERQLENQAAEKDAEIGRAMATIDRLDGDLQAARTEIGREREARGLVEEELRLLRQSLAMQEVERLKRVVRAAVCHLALPLAAVPRPLPPPVHLACGHGAWLVVCVIDDGGGRGGHQRVFALRMGLHIIALHFLAHGDLQCCLRQETDGVFFACVASAPFAYMSIVSR